MAEVLVRAARPILNVVLCWLIMFVVLGIWSLVCLGALVLFQALMPAGSWINPYIKIGLLIVVLGLHLRLGAQLVSWADDVSQDINRLLRLSPSEF